jgi:short-subunit dehydrogenase
MDLKLRGKRALITGSTQGIGFAIAEGLAREGADVVINGRTDAKVEGDQKIAGETKASVTGLAADVGTEKGMASCSVSSAPSTSCQQCPVSSSRSHSSESMTTSGSAISEVNVMSVRQLSRAAAAMLKQK